MKYIDHKLKKASKTIKKLRKRIISFLIVLALVTDTMYSGGLFAMFGFSTALTAEAAGEQSYTLYKKIEEYSSKEPVFGNNEDGFKRFVDYCYYYNSVDTFAEEHKKDTISIVFPSLSEDYGFMGLGNSTHPFAGTIQFIASDGVSNISLPRALFTYVSTDAKLMNADGSAETTLKITKNSGLSSPLLADHVCPGTNAEDSNDEGWKITVDANTNAFAGVFGQLEENANVKLQFNNESSAVVSNTGENDIKDVGELCGIMKTGSSLTVTGTATVCPAVSSTSGNAGSLVGTMEGTAALTLNNNPNFSAVSVTSNNGYAGGLVGKMTSEASIKGLASPLSVGGTVTGTTGAGGLFGHYTNSTARAAFDLAGYNITAAVYAQNCGGVFGVLENNKGTSETPVELTIMNKSNAGTVNVSSGSDSTYADTGYFGGIAGKYVTDDLKNSLILDNFSVTSTANAQFASFGGVIGIVDSAAYMKSDGLTVTSYNPDKKDTDSFFGGFVGKTSDTTGVFIDLGDFSLTASSFNGGGVVGSFKNGVLRLSGTTDMVSANASRGGQLVGANDNVLVYALGTGIDGTAYENGWSFKRSQTAAMVDDLGTWGEVVRQVNNGSADLNLEKAGIVSIGTDSNLHKVTLATAVTSGMNNSDEFARTALNIMLNKGDTYGGLFVFDIDSASSTLLGNDLSVDGSINLSGTGINGLMRDGGDINTIGSFTGTLNGNGNTVTLAAGESYGLDSTGATVSTNEGTGQIYRHQHNGLFAVLAGTVENLIVNGTINVRNRKSDVDDNVNAAMNIGGVASRNAGDVTLTGVTTRVTVNYHESVNINNQQYGKNIGGYIGYVGSNGTITITGVSSIGATFNLSGYHQYWNVYGGAIGKITAESFEVKIGEKGDANHKLTNSLKTDITGITYVGDNGNGGGLIGYITDAGDYNSRTVCLNNLEFNNCIVGNAASTNGGGFLGYAWLNTTTNINGVTVTGNSTIKNQAGSNNNAPGNVGVMLYSSTGKMTVDSLAVSSLAMSEGAGTSLGMIVNKAYDGNDGLYLDVLDAGYTLTGSGISLPLSLGVYDELAAYSANKVIDGGNGAGIVSVNMNSDREGSEAKITVTGTYQNQLTSASSSALVADKYANGNSRYYYNLGVLSNSDAGQNLLLWSLNKYAASNIAHEFKNTEEHPFGTTFDDTLTGEANLTGLSFYPLANAGDYILDGLKLTFDYSGIYSTDETTFANSVTLDNYVRDPGANDESKNQHYLMHSGLFINHPAGNTITVSVSSSIGGNFLEVGDYKAALISGTMNGNLKVTGSLELKGLTPKTTGNAAYADGYLLVHKISRPDNQTQTITMELQDISTSGYSSTGQTTVARSLIGPADGRSLNFKFSRIKLDARKKNVPDITVSGVNNALTTAYGTSGSIFSDATLVYSINTDQYANLIYNFTRDEDWGADGNGGRNVTYGSEITYSKEYENQEKHYYGDPNRYIRPDSDSNTEYTFSTDVFLPYVKESYNPQVDHTDKYYREIKVNVVTAVEWKGCGTYNDPYIIDDPRQLVTLSKFLQSGLASDLGSIILPIYDTSKYNGISNNTTGNRWCTDKTGDTYHVSYTNNGDTEFTATGKEPWPAKNVQYYLTGAYYKIEANFELGSGFIGLGGDEPNTAFRGVIVGEKDETGSPQYTITNTTDKPFIRVTNGCVIKDINIKVNVDSDSGISLAQANSDYDKAYFDYDYNNTKVCKFYGGIIGEIMGGDNIIDNSYVTFADSSKITLSGSKGTIVPVGGYVGVVVFGGLIFKNMDERKTTLKSTNLNVIYTGKTYNLADNSGQEAWAAIYVNPIVGRVINGYAVNETGGNAKGADGNTVQQFSQSENETYHAYHDEDGSTRENVTPHTLKNGKKHYSIADLDPNPNLDKLYVENVPANTTTDGTITIPNSQAMFVLSLITQSTSGTAQEKNGDYINSLSYGTVSGTVYGMSHNADYCAVETPKEDSAQVDDYMLASKDTAANTAVPYIITRYTKKIEDIKEIEISILGGVYICNKRYPNDENTWYLSNTVQSNNNLNHTAKDNAKLFTLARVNSGPYQGMYVFYYLDENNVKNYLWFNDGNDYNLRISTVPDYFNLTYIEDDGVWLISDNIDSSRYLNNSKDRYTGWKDGYSDLGNRLLLIDENNNNLNESSINSIQGEEGTISIETIKGGYNSRCVTSTLGYYDINLTGSDYVLPDSFRGLGSVGYYDDCCGANNTQVDPGNSNYTEDGYKTRANNKFSMKIDQFDGASNRIDVDIYLNKFLNDNYFNRLHSGTSQAVQSDTSNFGNENNDNKLMHGIGLFDSVVTKNENSAIKNFTISGSVNTEVYSNTYNKDSQQVIGTNGTAGQLLWLSTGGVCGWGSNGLWLKFDSIRLNNLSVRGSTSVGGLIGYSGNKSKTYYIRIQECSAENLNIILSASHTAANRHGIGAFVGKVKEGGVKIYGTSSKENNIDLSKYSTVEIGSFTCINGSSTIAGGLVGYAGNGCQVYDMHVKTTSGSTVTIGGTNVNMAGGIVGLMQPVEQYLADCVAEFVRCEVQNINVQANLYAGGLYGGTWNTGNEGWVPYTITIDSCEVKGDPSSLNTISATYCAGGFVADGLVYSGALPNIEIKDSKISYYNISNNKEDNYITDQTEPVGVGGFIGFARAQKPDANVTCYIHDSSVENCKITALDSGGHAGGAIGQIANKNSDATGNRMLGYNIRLDKVTSDSPDRMGAWVGNLNTSDSTTSIQFAGLAIYENGFTKNVGNRDDFTNASFVFAAYDKNMLEEGDNNSVPDVSELNKGTTVGMPEKPYVNINPQSSMGTGEIITGDGAVLRSKASQTTDYKGKTAEKTMALKIYEDIVADEDSRRYTTFGAYNNTDAAKINGGSKIDEYMQRTTVDDGDRISTYYTEKGITYHPDYADFACVVIANNTTEETTALINRYAQLVTNTTTDYAGTDSSNDYFNIVVKSCKFEKEKENENGKFVVDSSATPGLNYLNGQFSLNGLSADSRSDGDTFTLIDIQFMDPLTAGLDNEKKKIAYHLYIPVYTIKEIEVTFQATVLNGTNSVSYDAAGTENTNGYAAKLNKTASDTHVDNLNTWFTTYIRYTYSRDDLQALLDSGNLNWNHNKYFYLDKTGYDATRLLPSDTYMVLVDPNGNHDKQYQVLPKDTDFERVNNRITLDLSKFKDNQSNSFAVSTFNEMIAREIIATETGGKYTICNGTPEDTSNGHYVYTKDAKGDLQYYQYVGSGGDYNLTLPEDYELNENYYISMFVPGAENSNALYGYYIRTPEKFDAPTYTNNAITKSAKINCYYGTNTTTENRQVYIGNLFDQTTVLTVKPDDLEIDTGNKTLNIYAATTITPKNANVTLILNSINPSIYHSFNLFLDRKGENGLTTNDIYGLSNDGTDIQAWYSIGTQIPMDPNASMTGFTSIASDNIDLQENYINVTTTNSVSPSGVTIYSRVKLEFSAEGIMNEFPQRVTNDTGVSVRAASNLAYDSASLAFSSMSAPAEEAISTKHIYYRQSKDSASLNYYAKTEPDSFDADGLLSENLSRLGVNGKYSMNDCMPVNSTAQYNISSIESAAEDAEKLSLTLTLQKKTDTPDGGPYTAAIYQNVSSINSYWGAVQRNEETHEVVPNDEGKPVTVANTTNVRIKCGNYDQVIEVPENSEFIQLKIPKNTSENPGYLVDENGYIYIDVGFNAKTGENFTEYANYKVNLSVRLLDSNDKEITGSYAGDYLIYTNAKVNHDFLKEK